MASDRCENAGGQNGKPPLPDIGQQGRERKECKRGQASGS